MKIEHATLVITGYCLVALTVESKLSEHPECSAKKEGKMQIKLTSKENWTALKNSTANVSIVC